MDLDKSNPERLLRYYFGGYVDKQASDPFEVGLLVEENGRYYLDTDVFAERQPELTSHLQAAASSGTLTWEALEPFLKDTYYTARAASQTLDVLTSEVSYGGDGWMQVEIDGVMTTAQRHVYIAEAALRAALSSYPENDEQLLYPRGTTIVGEHWLEGKRIETTVMRKRADGFWDYFTYGQDGALASQTQALPRSLKTPTQCVGCHFGSKQFEPERSFPAEAPPGPHGPRALYVGDDLRDREVVAFFDEHRKRSDTILGLYNTLFVAQLRAERRAGSLSEADAALLDQLGL
ncbi:MAG TPA: hypothetical protein VKP65_25725 [Rhodothermales bacterium]|nr:hypothetical protein [Rhodothermales bacterium]